METFKNFDLSLDPEAQQYVKDEIVNVTFAVQPGFISSREGPNHYAIGDALLTGSTGDHWSVSRDRFDAKYLPLETDSTGENRQYRNRPMPVLAKQIQHNFQVERSAGGDIISGQAGDWLMQYAAGDYGIVANSKFCLVYKKINQSK